MFGSHKIKLEPGDLVIFSSKQIPGNELAIGRIQNELATQRVEMITDRQADVHVSGPSRPARAGGDVRVDSARDPRAGARRDAAHGGAGALRAARSGIPKAIVQQNGEVVRLAPDGPEIIGHERVGRLVLDGDVILPADGATMNERRRIATIGVISVAVPLDQTAGSPGDVELGLQGVPVEEDREAFLKEACEAALPSRRERRGRRGQAARGDPACRAPLRDRVDGQEAGRRSADRRGSER